MNYVEEKLKLMQQKEQMMSVGTFKMQNTENLVVSKLCNTFCFWACFKKKNSGVKEMI